MSEKTRSHIADVAYFRKKKTKFRIALNAKEKSSPLVLDLAEQEKFHKKQRWSFFCGVIPTRVFACIVLNFWIV